MKFSLLIIFLFSLTAESIIASASESSSSSSSKLSLCDPSTTSSTLSNAITHAGKNSLTSTSTISNALSSSNLYDGYLTWMNQRGVSLYTNSVYIPTSTNTCRGIGFHWTIDYDEDVDVDVNVSTPSDSGSDSDNNIGTVTEAKTKTGTIQIAVAVQVNSNLNSKEGWAAIGFSETGGMRGADVVYFASSSTSNENMGSIIDAHILDSLALSQPTPDMKQDWISINHIITDDGYLIFEAKRKLDTNDVFDRPFVDDSSAYMENHKLIAAWGPTPHISFDENNQVRTSIQLFHPRQEEDEEDENENKEEEVEEDENRNVRNTGVKPGLKYDQFVSEMSSRSDGSVNMTLTNFNIPLEDTHYHGKCFSTSDLIGLNSIQYIIGYQFTVEPDSIKYIHHMVIYGNAGGCSKTWDTTNRHAPIFVWTPGDDYLFFPDGAGMKIGQSDGFQSFTIEYHFDNRDMDVGKVDRGTGVHLYYTSAPVVHEIGMMQIGDPTVQLIGKEVGSGLTRHTLSCPSTCTQNRFNVEEITIVKEQLHMHSLGKRIVNQVLRDDAVIHESYVDYWDYDQSGIVAPMRRPFQMQRGDSFRTICYYDAHSSTKFGTGSEDEMCMAFVLYFPKQPMETCGVSFHDEMCRVNYMGKKHLSSVEELNRVLGNNNEACRDSETFTFGNYEFEGEIVTRDCAWINSSSAEINEKRRSRFCDEVNDKCPVACLECNITESPSVEPTLEPSAKSSSRPSSTSLRNDQTSIPTRAPNTSPFILPSSKPSNTHSSTPVGIHSSTPSVMDSLEPSVTPSLMSSSNPSIRLSDTPSISHSNVPSALRSSEPSMKPSVVPSREPSSIPSVVPSREPSSIPSEKPSATMVPSGSPSTHPSSMPSQPPSSQPSKRPSIPPSDFPSFLPSSSPTYHKQEFQLYISMQFDELSEFRGESKRLFEQEIDKLIKKVLDVSNTENFRVLSSIEGFEVVNTDTQARRYLSALKGGYSVDVRRDVQQSMPGLKVVIVVDVEVRSSIRYENIDLIEDIKTALDEEEERTAFILILQQGDNDAFVSINKMEAFTINNEEIRIYQRSGPDALIFMIVGIGIGVGALAIIVVGIVFIRRRRGSISLTSFTDVDYDPAPIDPRISS
jgi:hypothetical protein